MGNQQWLQQKDRAGGWGPIGHCLEQPSGDGLQPACLVAFGAEDVMANVLGHLHHTFHPLFVWAMSVPIPSQQLLSHGSPSLAHSPACTCMAPHTLLYFVLQSKHEAPGAISPLYRGYRGARYRESPCISSGGGWERWASCPARLGRWPGEACAVGTVLPALSSCCHGPCCDAGKSQFFTWNWWFWNVTDILMPWEPWRVFRVYLIISWVAKTDVVVANNRERNGANDECNNTSPHWRKAVAMYCRTAFFFFFSFSKGSNIHSGYIAGVADAFFKNWSSLLPSLWHLYHVF